MLNRTERAHQLAKLIEQVEHCPVMTDDSIKHIERALTDYAIEHLVRLRAAIVEKTMSAAMKTRLVSMVDAAIATEANS